MCGQEGGTKERGSGVMEKQVKKKEEERMAAQRAVHSQRGSNDAVLITESIPKSTGCTQRYSEAEAPSKILGPVKKHHIGPHHHRPREPCTTAVNSSTGPSQLIQSFT